MAGNSAFELVSERGWRRGLDNMLRNEMDLWWKTSRWWRTCLVWTFIIGLLLSTIIFQTSSEPRSEEAAALLYAIFAGFLPAINVVIMMQSTVVGEKQDGTAAWVLSKPVTRPAFLLSKLFGNSLGMLATMVLVPGIVAYTLYAIASGTPWNLAGFITAQGVIFLFNFFFLSLTLMLGTLFSSRGPVIGIALGVLLGQQFLVGILPGLGYLLPWNLIFPISEPVDAVVPCLLTGSQNYSIIPVVAVALESLIFVLVGLYRFNREEF
jgi:ABC-2 type transport system permease protein